MSAGATLRLLGPLGVLFSPFFYLSLGYFVSCTGILSALGNVQILVEPFTQVLVESSLLRLSWSFL